MVTFNEVPASIRVPGVYVETGASTDQVVGGDQPYRMVILGQRLAGGIAAANVPIRVLRAADGLSLFGQGSMLAQATAAALANVSFVDLWVIPMDDPSGGTAATGSMVFTSDDNAAGTLPVYVLGERLPVALTAGMTAAEIATAVAAAINGDVTLPVTAATASGTVTVTAKHLGTIGNEIGLGVALGEGEVSPSGVGITLNAMSSGAGEPDLDAALAAMGDAHYNVVVAPYQEPALLTAVAAEMDARSSATRQLGGVAFTASTGNFATLTTLGLTQNSERLVIVGASGSPSAPWEWASATAALVARDAPENPARAYTGVAIRGVRAGASSSRLIATERQILLQSGIATVQTGNTGVSSAERLITSYRENALGSTDLTFLDVTSVLTLERLRFDLRTVLQTKFGRATIVDVGTPVAPGRFAITVEDVRAEVIAL
ncbi:MAG: phage tail sheath subtilisin-like domain-containing protein, partial [Planctomycetota bacterium]